MCRICRPSLSIMVAPKPEPMNAPTAQAAMVRLAFIGL